MQASIGACAINPALQDDLPYDPRKDLDMLTSAVRTQNALIMRPTMEAATLRELIAKLKAEPTVMLFASSGTGSSDHLTAELFWQVTGTSGIHVLYKGGGPAKTELMGGHADAFVAAEIDRWTEVVKAGEIKPEG